MTDIKALNAKFPFHASWPRPHAARGSLITDRAHPQLCAVPTRKEAALSTQFRKRFDGPRLSAEEAARQGRAARLAWERMPEKGEAVVFLNAHDAGLGGRPIDLAVASDAGLRAVEEAIAARGA